MPRQTVPLVTNETYHVYNRGVDKRKVFLDKADYFRFHTCLQLFNTEDKTGSIYELHFKKDWVASQKPLVKIHAYCLLSNHFHLLLTQARDGGISEFMKRLSGGYTSYFNERYDRTGALFQGRFKRVHVESNEQLVYLGAYVNLNNQVHDRKDYYLSSYEAYAGTRLEKFVCTNLILDQYSTTGEFVAAAQKLVEKIAAERKLDVDINKHTLLE